MLWVNLVRLLLISFGVFSALALRVCVCVCVCWPEHSLLATGHIHRAAAVENFLGIKMMHRSAYDSEIVFKLPSPPSPPLTQVTNISRPTQGAVKVRLCEPVHGIAVSANLT